MMKREKKYRIILCRTIYSGMILTGILDDTLIRHSGIIMK